MVLKPIESLDTYIPDDSFLSLKISKNIAEGKGPLYSNSYTNGFQPLFVFIMVPAYWLYPNDLIIPLKIALIVSAIFDTLSLLLILKIILNFTRSKKVLIFASLTWILNSFIISTTMNGLETIMSTFFILSIIYYLIKYSILETDNNNLLKMFVFGILSGIATFARIDSAILSFIIYLYISFNLIAKKKSYLNFFKITLVILAGFLIAYSPWMIYSYIYTGLIYPISGKAVRFQSTYHISNLMTNTVYYSGILKTSVKIIVRNNLALCASLFISLIMIIIKGKFKELLHSFLKFKEIILLILFAITLLTAYSFYLPATWFFPRYYFPFTPIFVLLFAFIFSKLEISNFKITFITIFLIFIIIESYRFQQKRYFHCKQK